MPRFRHFFRYYGPIATASKAKLEHDILRFQKLPPADEIFSLLMLLRALTILLDIAAMHSAIRHSHCLIFSFSEDTIVRMPPHIICTIRLSPGVLMIFITHRPRPLLISFIFRLLYDIYKAAIPLPQVNNMYTLAIIFDTPRFNFPILQLYFLYFSTYASQSLGDTFAV